MDDKADPALQFFPEGEVDLYGALQVDKEAGQDEIKKAYRKMALRYHPDKVLSSSSTSSIDPHQKFQQIGFAYSVLSDEARRKRYDATGRTNESMFEQDGFSWDEYFKEMWQGSVSGEKLDEFKKNYQHSDEERDDLLEAYETAQGDLATIFTLVPCSEILEDEERFISLINAAIKSGELEALPKWKKTTGDEKGRKKMREGARKEANEAEEYAKELGVWDDLYGKGRKGGASGDKGEAKKPKKAVGKDEEVEVVGDVSSDEEEGGDEEDEEEEDEPIQAKKRNKQPTAASSSNKKPKAASKAKAEASSKSKAGSSSSASKPKKSPSKKAKGGEAAEEEDDDMDGLRALMAKRGEERNRGFNSMIARMEAQAQAEASAKGGRKKKKGGGMPMFDEPRREADEPDEEAFLKARAKVDARKRSKEEKAAKGQGSNGEGASKKTKKT